MQPEEKAGKSGVVLKSMFNSYYVLLCFTAVHIKVIYQYTHIYIYTCINANAIASSWRYNFLWPKAELMLKHPKSSLWRYDTRLNNSKRRTVKPSFIAASRYEPLKTGTLQPGIKTQNTGTLVTHVDSVTAAVSQCFSFLCCSDSQCERSFGTSVKNKVESTDFIPDVWNTSIKQISQAVARRHFDQLHGSSVRKSQQWTFPSPSPEIETLPEFNQ